MCVCVCVCVCVFCKVKLMRIYKYNVYSGKLTFSSAWRQGFSPSSTEGLSYGIVQREGGPCGVLATVQAFMLRHLLFMDPSLAASRPPAPCSRKVFEEALLNGLADILWQAGNGRQAIVAVFAGKRRLSGAEEDALRKALCRSDDFTEMLSLFVCASRAQVPALFVCVWGWVGVRVCLAVCLCLMCVCACVRVSVCLSVCLSVSVCESVCIRRAQVQATRLRVDQGFRV